MTVGKAVDRPPSALCIAASEKTRAGENQVVAGANSIRDRMRYAPRWQRMTIFVVALGLAIPLSTNDPRRNFGLTLLLSVLIVLAVTAVGYLFVIVGSYIQHHIDRSRKRL